MCAVACRQTCEWRSDSVHSCCEEWRNWEGNGARVLLTMKCQSAKPWDVLEWSGRGVEQANINRIFIGFINICAPNLVGLWLVAALPNWHPFKRSQGLGLLMQSRGFTG